MDDIGVFSPEQARTLWQDYLTRQQSQPQTQANYPQRRLIVERSNRRLQVILTTDLFAAVNTKRDPSTATARILVKKPDGDLTLSTRSITVVNRFQHISVDAGTYAKAEWIDGEWQLYAADCAAGDSSGSA